MNPCTRCKSFLQCCICATDADPCLIYRASIFPASSLAAPRHCPRSGKTVYSAVSIQASPRPLQLIFAEFSLLRHTNLPNTSSTEGLLGSASLQFESYFAILTAADTVRSTCRRKASLCGTRYFVCIKILLSGQPHAKAAWSCDMIRRSTPPSPRSHHVVQDTSVSTRAHPGKQTTHPPASTKTPGTTSRCRTQHWLKN